MRLIRSFLTAECYSIIIYKTNGARYLPQYTLPSRRTAGRRLHDMYLVEKEKLIGKLATVHWMSATADIWSVHKRL